MSLVVKRSTELNSWTTPCRWEEEGAELTKMLNKLNKNRLSQSWDV